MFLKRFFVSGLIAVLLAASLPLSAQAIGTRQDMCESGGGVWSGSSPISGNCTYATASVGDDSSCATVYTTFYYLDGVYTGDTTCSNDAPGGDGADGAGAAAPAGENPGTPGGPYGNQVTDPADTTLCLKNPMNGCVTFVGAEHIHKCAITPNLPVGSGADLPPDTVDTLYVNVVEKEGVSDTHSICFNTEGIENPVLYQYIAGAWVTVASGGYGGQICTTHTGDGSFALASE